MSGWRVTRIEAGTVLETRRFQADSEDEARERFSAAVQNMQTRADRRRVPGRVELHRHAALVVAADIVPAPLAPQPRA